jgi:hypothetical protein
MSTILKLILKLIPLVHRGDKEERQEARRSVCADKTYSIPIVRH